MSDTTNKTVESNTPSPSIAQSAVARLHADGTANAITDDVVVEEPLEIRLGNSPFVVTMRTPGHDRELAAGFLVSEGIVKSKADFKEIDRCKLSPTPENTIRVRFNESVDSRNIDSNRFGAVSASCGVCGKTSIESIQKALPEIQSQCQVDRQIMLSLPERLREHQAVFDRTGGLHSSGLFDCNGDLICLREDVGRHNALDKVIGYATLNDRLPLDNCILMVSGRVSFEIIQKALAARIPIVAAVSAPSSLAISLARDSGQTLIGFLRNPRMNVYAHPQRIAE